MGNFLVTILIFFLLLPFFFLCCGCCGHNALNHTIINATDCKLQRGILIFFFISKMNSKNLACLFIYKGFCEQKCRKKWMKTPFMCTVFFFFLIRKRFCNLRYFLTTTVFLIKINVLHNLFKSSTMFLIRVRKH